MRANCNMKFWWLIGWKFISARSNICHSFRSAFAAENNAVNIYMMDVYYIYVRISLDVVCRCHACGGSAMGPGHVSNYHFRRTLYTRAITSVCSALLFQLNIINSEKITFEMDCALERGLREIGIWFSFLSKDNIILMHFV